MKLMNQLIRDFTSFWMCHHNNTGAEPSLSAYQRALDRFNDTWAEFYGVEVWYASDPDPRQGCGSDYGGMPEVKDGQVHMNTIKDEAVPGADTKSCMCKAMTERSYPAYVLGTTLKQIIEDGWCRGFDEQQTLEEAHAQGFTWLTIPVIQECWKRTDQTMMKDIVLGNPLEHHERIHQVMNIHGTQTGRFTTKPIASKGEFLAGADDIIFDCWFNGVSLEATMDALHGNGFLTSRNAVIETWATFDDSTVS